MAKEDKSQHLDDLADRLIEKQQKFVYFFITANIGVIIYSTNFFLGRTTDITTPITNTTFWLLLIGCISLLVSTVSCIIYLFSKNKAYEKYLDSLYEVKLFKSPYKKLIIASIWTMFISFGLGMLLNVVAYLYHSFKVDRLNI